MKRRISEAYKCHLSIVVYCLAVCQEKSYN